MCMTIFATENETWKGTLIGIRSCCCLLLLLGLAYSIHLGARPFILTLISVDKIQISLLTVTQVSLQPHLTTVLATITKLVKYSIIFGMNYVQAHI